MSVDKMYTNEYWKELIDTIISRIGTDAFLRLSAAVLKDTHGMLAEMLIEYANDITRDCEEWDYSGREKDEWKYEAVEAMKLKR